MRVPLIAGNWKMYKTAAEAEAFVLAFLPLVSGVRGVEIVLAPPYPSIGAVALLVRGSGIGVASQNVHYADEGAFTGEVSIRMLQEAGATHCIIGHSERRQYFAESDDAVNRKVRATLAAGLTPILCVGETDPEREGGKTFDVVGRQLAGGTKEIPASMGSRVVVAYEPVWAIGTGKTATPAQAQEVHAFLRGRLKELWGGAADAVRILYGGSVKPDNIAALMANEDIDGALVGGASLSPGSFAKIVTFH
ncbi:triose-phosphate isomerase [Candidatus Deferrimicrobium sp.]|uniref:triose-phosphate isomerase n=1 Tax=Candidatus Deferrimicrobium sp. TaxID=3060586 RepID=UPI002EDB8BD4